MDPKKKTNDKVTSAIAVTIVFIVLIFTVYMSLSANAAQQADKDAAQSAVAQQKSPANIVLEEAGNSSEGEGSGRRWRVTVQFRETTGNCGSHAKVYLFYTDGSGKQWVPFTSESDRHQFDIPAGGTYDFIDSLTNMFENSKWGGSLLNGDVVMSSVTIKFSFEDEGGRKQTLEYTFDLK